MKYYYSFIISLLIVNSVLGQHKSTIRLELESNVESLNSSLLLLNDDHRIGIIKNVIVENPDLNGCIEVETNEEKNLKLIDILDRMKLLDEVYALIGFEYHEIDSDKIIETDDVEFFIQLDYQPPGHFESLFILIHNKIQVKEITSELSKVFGSEYCLKKMRRIALRKMRN